MKKEETEKISIQIRKKSRFLKSGIYIFASSLLYSFGFHYFVSASRFAPGGIGGILAMAKYLIGAYGNTSVVDLSMFLILLLNIPLVIWACKVLSPSFAIKTFAVCALTSIMLFFLDNFIDPLYAFSIGGTPGLPGTGERFLAAVFGGVLCGMSLASALKIGASTGGADVIGLILQKKRPYKSAGSMILIVNSVIVSISVFVYKDNMIPVLLAFVYLYVSSHICDRIVQGEKSVIKFELITEHQEEISEEIITHLGHGVTVTPAVGMFEHKNKSLLICLIRPRQISKFQEIIKQFPDTFAYFAPVGQVFGKFDSDKE